MPLFTFLCSFRTHFWNIWVKCNFITAIFVPSFEKKCGFYVVVLCFYYPQSKEGKSPLHMAAIHGRFTRSQILIQNGNHNKAVWLTCKNTLWQACLPSNGSLIDSPLCTFHQVGRLIVWISMAIPLSTLLLSTAMNCWSALWWPTEQTRPGRGNALSGSADECGAAVRLCKSTFKCSNSWNEPFIYYSHAL